MECPICLSISLQSKQNVSSLSLIQTLVRKIYLICSNFPGSNAFLPFGRPLTVLLCNVSRSNITLAKAPAILLMFVRALVPSFLRIVSTTALFGAPAAGSGDVGRIEACFNHEILSNQVVLAVDDSSLVNDKVLAAGNTLLTAVNYYSLEVASSSHPFQLLENAFLTLAGSWELMDILVELTVAMKTLTPLNSCLFL